MTLTEFLLTANADDDIALADWQAIPSTETIYMATSTMNALLADKKLKIPFKKAAVDSTHPFQDYADVFVDSTLQSTDFNFNPESTMGASVVGMLNEMATGPFTVDGTDYSDAIGLLRDLLVYLGSKVTYRNKGTTLEQVKAIRYPATWLACEHSGQAHVVSASYSDILTLAATLVDNVTNISVRCYWATAVGAQEYLSQSSVNLRGMDALFVSQSFTRANLGLPTTARILRFEYTSAYDGVVSSVSVSK
jgi:hypothetical protein